MSCPFDTLGNDCETCPLYCEERKACSIKVIALHLIKEEEKQ